MKRNKLFWSLTAFLTILLFNPISGQAVQGKTSSNNQDSSKSSKDSPVDYQVPVISGQKNTESAEIKTKIKLYLPRQNSNEFYEDMSFQVNLSEYSKDLTAKNTKIKMTDEASGEDLSSYFPAPKFSTSVEGENLLKFSLSKSKLKELANKVTDHDIVMTVEIAAPMASDESIKEVYDSTEKGFKVPVPVNHETLGGNTSNAFVGMQLSADPVKDKEVQVGTTTDDLKAKDYVENVKSLYPDDEFTYSFKEKVEFTETGKQKVNVVVKSNNTDVEKVVSASVYANTKASSLFLKHPYTTFVNKEGDFKYGKSLPDDMEGIIPLKYLGDKLSDNLYIKANKNSDYIKWDGKRLELSTQAELILEKVGVVKGEYIKAYLKFKYTSSSAVILDKDNSQYLSFSTYYPEKYSMFEITLLDKDNNPIDLKNVVLPIAKSGPAKGAHLNASESNLMNVIVPSLGEGTELTDEKSIYAKDILTASVLTPSFDTKRPLYDLYWSTDDSSSNYVFNLFYNQFSTISAGVAENSTPSTSRVYGFFDKTAPIYVPIDYSVPVIIGKRNTTTADIKSVVRLYLPSQSVDKFYKDMSFQVNLSEYSENLTSDNVSIKFSEESQGKDISSYFSAPTFSTSATGEQLLNFSLTPDKLKALAESEKDSVTGEIKKRDFVVDIDISAPLDPSKLKKEIYDATNNEFKLPISVNHEELGGNSSEAYVGMHLSADAVKGIQSQRGMSTDDLNAEELIENVESLYPNDEFTYSFKEKVDFEVTGPQVVNVIVKSNNTGAEIVVPVKLTIVDNPLVFVTITESIDLKQVEKTVLGEGKVGYTGPAGVNIEVDFSDPVKLTSSEKDTVDLSIFNESKNLVRPGEQLAMLNKTKKSATFSMNAPKAKFKKVDIYEGSMLVNFTIK